nr:S-layer homology domain-containing protein [uncultured Dysosmobacter sp.]
MKKFLSLVLALVMTMSLVTISAGAKDFTDDDKVTYEEAVNVISEIGVVDGYTDGSFNPQGSLTRGAAAKIICNMILGPTTAAELHADTAPYKDVPTNHTFAGYIAYCAKEGIISGYADGTFRPAGTLTGYAFMKMLLGALGYDASIEGYTGANWSINVAKQALAIGLNKSLEGDFNGIKAVNREEAALYAFNTLKSDLVEYDTTISTTINGQTVTIGNSQAKAQKWNNSATRINNIENDEYIQFAEQYFNKLVLEDTTDAFGRPARTWSWKSDDIGTYINHDLLVASYTEKVTGKDLYDAMGKNVIDDYDIDVYVDGEVDDDILGDAFFDVADMNKNNKGGVGETGDGVLTEVYVDADNKEATVAVINTYLARAKSDYNEKKDEVSFTVYKIDAKGADKDQYVKTAGEDETLTVSGDDFDIKDIAEKDAYLVNIAEGEIKVLAKAEVLEDSTLTAFSKESYVITDGTKYEYADTLRYDPEVLDEWTDSKINLKEKSYNLYLDQYGFLIGIDLVEEADNYVFITGVDDSASNLAATNIKANAIFLDGTMETITINTKKSTGTFKDSDEPSLINRWFTYTVNKDGIYSVDEINDTINPAKNTQGETHSNLKLAQFATKDLTGATGNEVYDIDVKHVSLPGNAAGTGDYTKVYGNDSTVYLTAEVETINPEVSGNNYAYTGIISDVTNVTTGIKNANLTTYNLAKAKSEADDNAKVVAPVAAAMAAYGAYTLYKNNGYIIATVVVGEDDAAAKNLVYVTSSDIELESYDSEADEWTWTREVIYNGEEIEIKEVGDKLTHLDKMERYNWYQVRFNSSDEVIGVQLAEKALTHTVGAPTNIGNEYVDQTNLVELAVNAKDTVLFEKSEYEDELDTATALYNQPKVPYLVGGTFYVETDTHTGFRVNDDVKYVFIQKNNNKTSTTIDEGVENLADAVEELNTNKNGSYDYEVSAILVNGAATVVVIRDLNSDGYKVDHTTDHDHVVEAVYDRNYTYTIKVSDYCAPTYMEIADAIKEEMESLRATDITVTFDSKGITEVTYTTQAGTPVTLSLASGTLNIVVENVLTKAVESAKSAGYTFGGTFSGDEDSITITYPNTIDPMTDKATGENQYPYLLTDVARFLGGLYRSGNAAVIEFEDEAYTWDASIGNAGSNWANKDGDTLVSEIVSYVTANSKATDIELTIDGVEITLSYEVKA